MSKHISKFFKLSAIATALVCASAAQATVVTYTNQAAFLSALGTAVTGTDTFDDLLSNVSYAGPLSRTAGSYSYTASAGPASPTLYGAGGASDAWLSTNVATDPITLDSFASGVFAAGAQFFDSNVKGKNRILPGSITVTATDGSGSTSQLLTNPTPSTFVGFISTGQLLSVVVTAASPFAALPAWPTVNNLTLAVAAVPEPETALMLLGGLSALGFLARRRRSQA